MSGENTVLIADRICREPGESDDAWRERVRRFIEADSPSFHEAITELDAAMEQLRVAAERAAFCASNARIASSELPHALDAEQDDYERRTLSIVVPEIRDLSHNLKTRLVPYVHSLAARSANRVEREQQRAGGA